ncbi:MAG: DUF5105 domain-containing protein [Aminipila sp.]
MKKVFVIFLVLTLITGLVGCGGESPEKAVENALNAVKNMNKELASKYLDYDELMSKGEFSEDTTTEDNADSEAIMKLILKNLEYKVISSNIDGESAIVETEITNVDMSKIMADFISEMFGGAFSGVSEEQVNDKCLELFTNLINKPDNKMVTNTVKIKLLKDDTNWKIDMSDELADAILGGMISASKDMGTENGSDEDKLNEIDNWLIGDIWNDGLCDIDHYTYNGTGSAGDTIDIDFTLSQFDTAIKKKAEYDKYINSLDDTQYSQIKSIWVKLSLELDTLYNQIQTNKPTANDTSTNVDTGKFQQYQNAFSDAVNDIK